MTAKYSFNNSYEQSKFEAEMLVRAALQDGLPGIIFRPSIILGAATDGRFKKTSVLYPMLFLFNTTIMPLVYKVKLDIVSIDYVVNAILYIAEKTENLGCCFNLAAGGQRSMYETELLKIVVKELELKRVVFILFFLWIFIVLPGLKLFNPALYKRIIKVRMVNTMGGYANYFRDKNPEFDITETDKALAGSGITSPAVGELFRRCIHYAKNYYFKN